MPGLDALSTMRASAGGGAPMTLEDKVIKHVIELMGDDEESRPYEVYLISKMFTRVARQAKGLKHHWKTWIDEYTLDLFTDFRCDTNTWDPTMGRPYTIELNGDIGV